MKHPQNTLSLVADIGGTNTRCALADGMVVLERTIRRYSNADYDSLETVLRQFLADENGVDPIAACVALAGPVRNGCGSLTNLDWQIDETTLSRATKAENVAILNDLQAQGYAIGQLPEGAIQPILTGSAQAPDHEPVRLMIGVGTGFNAAPVLDTRFGRSVPASESGHIDLPVKGDLEHRLRDFTIEQNGFAAVEDVLSGRGLEHVYRFLGEDQGNPKSASAKEIMTACQDGTDTRSSEAVALFCQVLGRVCGNLSLIQLPFSGIYLVGGVARAISPYLHESGFADSFADKGRFSDFMSNFSVSIIEDDYAALTGAASFIGQRLKD